jgi:ribosomal protein S18 acetylase RimI-like enzyme
LTSSDIVVRSFEEGDMVTAARVFTRAFGEKMRTLTCLPEEDWPDLLVASRALPLSSFKGHLVAEVAGRLVGMMALDWKGKGRPPSPGSGPTRRFSWRQRWRVRAAQWVVTVRARPGDLYVQYIGVEPEAQGRGVGTALLEEGEALAREMGLLRYTLYVAADNPGARRLYERLGFRERRRLRSRVTRRLLGVEEWVYMVKAL